MRGDEEIDPEVWLQFMILFSGDEEKRKEMVNRIAQNTGFTPEKVETILKALMQTLVAMTRSN